MNIGVVCKDLALDNAVGSHTQRLRLHVAFNGPLYDQQLRYRNLAFEDGAQPDIGAFRRKLFGFRIKLPVCASHAYLPIADVRPLSGYIATPTQQTAIVLI